MSAGDKSAPAGRGFLRGEEGAATAFGLFLAVIFLAVGGLAIDYAYANRVRTQMQTASDAAAIAALPKLPDNDAALSAARQYVALNDPGDQFAPQDGDVALGLWSDSTRKFTETAVAPNAVRVSLKREESRSNALPTFLLKLVNFNFWNLDVETIAAVVPECAGGGLIARGSVTGNSNNRFYDDFCLYGKSVDIGSNNFFEKGTELSLPDLKYFKERNNNNGTQEALRERKREFKLVAEVDGILKGIEAGTAPLPSWVTQGPLYVKALPRYPVRNTLYVVDGDVVLKNGLDIEEVAILALGDLTVRNNSNLASVVLAAKGAISVASNVRIGRTGYCSGGAFDSYIVSRGPVDMGSNIDLTGVQLATKSDFAFNSNVGGIDGFFAEAGGNVTFNSNTEFYGCNKGVASDLFMSSYGKYRMVM